MRAAAAAALVVALTAGIGVMREATQNRPDATTEGSVSVLDFDVAVHGFRRGEPAAASALWLVCSAAVGGEVSPLPEPVEQHWRVEITPAIGEHGAARLIGCLEDVTIDRVLGDVLALRTAA